MSSRIQSSPLLKDTRYWNEIRDDSALPQQLPGSTEDDFTASVLNTLERRLRPHSHAISVPALEKILTPVMEREDNMALYSDDDDDEESNIVSVSLSSGNASLDRRRTHSLTKGEGYGGDTEELEHDCVFHSRSPSNISNKSRKLFSRSEDNLLSPDNEKPTEQSNGNAFEVAISSLVQKSNESVDSFDSQEYRPFQSDDVAQLFDSPDLSSRFFLGGPEGQPLRQMSDGNIKTDPSFAIGSPPLLSPTSLGKTTSLLSSQGSISDSTSESGPPGLERTCDQGVSLQRKNSMKRGSRGRRELYPLHNTKGEGLTDSGVDYPLTVSVDEEDSQSNEDIPLPDDSAHVLEPIRVNHIVYRYSSSRDSGLSDSPDPALELGSPTSHPVSSRVLTDRLSLMEREGKPSPLIIEHSKKPPPVEKRCRSEGGIMRHVTKVLKITPSMDLEFPSSDWEQGISGGGEGSVPVQRLRMASPDELLMSPEMETLPTDMKRSKSHVGGSFSGDKEEEERDLRSRVGEFIISEARITRRASRVLCQRGLPNKELSKSLETL